MRDNLISLTSLPEMLSGAKLAKYLSTMLENIEMPSLRTQMPLVTNISLLLPERLYDERVQVQNAYLKRT